MLDRNARVKVSQAVRSNTAQMSDPASEHAVKRYRTLFLSDLHLGARGAQAELLVDFLKHNDADTFYLVGDIVDGWRLKNGWYWPQAHNDVVQKLLRKAGRRARRLVRSRRFARGYTGIDSAARRRRRPRARGPARREPCWSFTAISSATMVVRNARRSPSSATRPMIAIVVDHWFDRARRTIGVGCSSLSASAKSRSRTPSDSMAISTRLASRPRGAMSTA